MSFQSFSQIDSIWTKGKKTFRVYTKPGDGAIIKLDSTYLTYGMSHYIDSGKYKITAWAPGRQLVEKEIHLSKYNFNIIRIRLPKTDAYKKHRRSLKFYQIKKQSLRYLIIGGFAMYAANSFNKIQRLEENSDIYLKTAKVSKSNYENSIWPSDIEYNRTSYKKYKLAYDEAQVEIFDQWKEFGIYTGIAGVCAFFSWKYSNKLEKPEFKEVPLLSSFELMPRLGRNSLGLHLTMKVK